MAKRHCCHGTTRTRFMPLPLLLQDARALIQGTNFDTSYEQGNGRVCSGRRVRRSAWRRAVAHEPIDPALHRVLPLVDLGVERTMRAMNAPALLTYSKPHSYTFEPSMRSWPGSEPGHRQASFRFPHCTTSYESQLKFRGRAVRPGKINLGHRGVRFPTEPVIEFQCQHIQRNVKV